MAPPTLEKTWSFNVNNYITDDANGIMFVVKNALLELPAQPWTCWGSCDSANFGNGDGVDRWIDSNDVKIGTGAHSWFVFNIPGFNPKTQLLIDLSIDEVKAVIRFSYSAGFGAANGGTDGNTTTRPTATDEVDVTKDSYWSNFSVSEETVVHAMQATDGSAHRLFINRAGNIYSAWFFEIPKNVTDPGWSNPLIASIAAGTVDVLNYVRIGSLSEKYLRVYYNGSAMTASFTFESIPGHPLHRIGIPDQFNNQWPLSGVGVYVSESGYRGRKCELYDLWWGGLPGGDVHSGGELAQMSEIVVPWNGSVLIWT